MQKSEIAIRPMELSDLDRVLVIENASFALPFSKKLFKNFLGQGSVFSIVVTIDCQIVGYAMYTFVADESEILNIAVEEGRRQGGLGAALMKYLLKHVTGLNAKEVFLEVRPSNSAARNFYKKFDFLQVGIRKGYYHDTNEDALVLRKSIC